jgi:hypothetical protein
LASSVRRVGCGLLRSDSESARWTTGGLETDPFAIRRVGSAGAQPSKQHAQINKVHGDFMSRHRHSTSECDEKSTDQAPGRLK